MLPEKMLLEGKRLVSLAWPLLIAQITQMLMGVSDTIMAGRYGATDMAAVAIGFSITVPLMSFIQGIAFALPPIISRHHGAGETSSVANATQQAGYLLAIIGLIFIALSFWVNSAIGYIPMEPQLMQITTDYVQAVLLAMPGFALYQWLRNYCEGLGITKPTMMITVIGLCVNIVANYIFIYGFGPIPSFGGAGCGIATAMVIYAMFFITLFYVSISHKLKKYCLFDTFYQIDLKQIGNTLKLGLPIAMTILFEVSLFAVIALLLAPFGAKIVAAHQVALNFSALMFMFPLSLGMALAIRVGYRIGQQNYAQAATAVKSALTICSLVSICTATFTILAKSYIIGLYTQDEQVAEIANFLLLFAAAFQFSDAIQVVCANALRGYKDTTAMLLITLCAYWFIGMPTGIILGTTTLVTHAPMAATGFWIGIIVGLTSAAVMLALRFLFVQKKYAHMHM